MDYQSWKAAVVVAEGNDLQLCTDDTNLSSRQRFPALLDSLNAKRAVHWRRRCRAQGIIIGGGESHGERASGLEVRR